MSEYLQVWRARITAIGELYRFDRFAAPAGLWAELQRRYPELLGAG